MKYRFIVMIFLSAILIHFKLSDFYNFFDVAGFEPWSYRTRPTALTSKPSDIHRNSYKLFTNFRTFAPNHIVNIFVQYIIFKQLIHAPYLDRCVQILFVPFKYFPSLMSMVYFNLLFSNKKKDIIRCLISQF